MIFFLKMRQIRNLRCNIHIIFTETNAFIFGTLLYFWKLSRAPLYFYELRGCFDHFWACSYVFFIVPRIFLSQFTFHYAYLNMVVTTVILFYFKSYILEVMILQSATIFVFFCFKLLFIEIRVF